MDPYLGEIRMFAGNFAPQGWAKCDGQLLRIADYEVLFALIGTAYGGDGTTNFALPDLRGRIPIHISGSYPLGTAGGTEEVTLTSAQIPSHTHIPQADSALGRGADPTGQFWASNDYENFLPNIETSVVMNSGSVSSTGGNQPHENMMPSLGVTYIIALQGEYPNSN